MSTRQHVAVGAETRNADPLDAASVHDALESAQMAYQATPVGTTSRKGVVRASLLRMLDEAIRDRGLVVTVGRSADFS